MANEIKFGSKVVFLGSQPITVPVLAADPGSAVNGDMYYNTVSNKIKVYVNGAWHVLQEDGISVLTGDVSATGPGSASAVIGTNVVSNSKLAQMPAHTFKGNNSGSTANTSDLTATQLTAELNNFTGDSGSGGLKGLVPAPAAGDTAANKFLKADGTWVPVSGTATSALDGAFVIENTTDNTKQIKFDASGVSTGTTRTITMPDAAVNLTDVNNSILKDGSRAFTAAQSMGGFKLTNLAAGTANGDALRYNELGANNGIATLDSGGKVPLSQLPSTILEYKGTWDASSNTPTLADGTGTSGWFYIVSVAGTQNLGSGPIAFALRDWVMYNGTTWENIINSNTVASVNGQTGAVVINAINQLTGDVTAGPASGSQSAATTIATGAVTNAKIAAAAGITRNKLAALSANRVVVTDGSGFDADNSSSDVAVVTNSLQRGKSGSALITEEYVDSTTLIDNSGPTSITAFSFAHASFVGQEITYTVVTGAGTPDIRMGTIRLVSNGTATSITDMYEETADCGITWSASISGANTLLSYTCNNQGTNRTLRADRKLFRK